MSKTTIEWHTVATLGRRLGGIIARTNLVRWISDGVITPVIMGAQTASTGRPSRASKPSAHNAARRITGSAM